MNRKVSELCKSLIEEWCRSLLSEGKSESTIRGYSDSAYWFHAWLGDVEPSAVETSQIRAWIAHRIETTSKGNANNNYRALQQWFNWLVDEEEISSHPMARMKPPKAPEAPVPVVREDLMKRVLATCKTRTLLSRRDEAIIRLLWDTGCRLSEIGNLQLDDIDLDLDVIRVLGKGGKVRAVPFSAKTGQTISRYLRLRKQHPQAEFTTALWLGDRGRGGLQPNGIKLMLRRRGHKAGVNEEIGRNLHAHLGRHFVAHHAQAEGMSEGDLMLLMGWSSPQMPKRYGKSAATERAHASARRIGLGNRL